MACGPGIAVAHFREMYPRASMMQGPLALIGGALGLAAWLTGESIGWLAFGGLLATAVPWTLAIMLPTNNRLQDSTLEPGSNEAEQLLTRWGGLHFARTAASVAALTGMIVLLVR
jgi:hypothetical protein